MEKEDVIRAVADELAQSNGTYICVYYRAFYFSFLSWGSASDVHVYPKITYNSL